MLISSLKKKGKKQKRGAVEGAVIFSRSPIFEVFKVMLLPQGCLPDIYILLLFSSADSFRAVKEFSFFRSY